MNSQLKINIIISLFIFSCSDDKIQIISNIPPDLPNQNYKINLKSNSGSFLANVTIYWDPTEGEVELYDTGDSINFYGNSHTFSGMNPGEFRDISIQVDSTYVDSIQIFTRPVYPATNFVFKVKSISTENGQKHLRSLSWSPTKELQENFSKYIIYRSDTLISPGSCNCEIDNLSSLSDSTYIDSSFVVIEKSGKAAFYYMVQVSAGDNTRNSFIYNYTNFTSPSKISLANSNVSMDNNEFIQITWDLVLDPTYFYQYEIWRSPDEELSDTTLLAIITNPEQGKFMDRAVGTGTTWYYSVAVVDINGNRKFSDFISGWSLP